MSRALAIAATLALTGCGSKVVIVGAPEPEPPRPSPEEQGPERPPLPVAGEPNEQQIASTSACDLDAALAGIGRGCERLRGNAAVGTGAQTAASAAFDGDVCSVWNSGGFPPQSATLDLGAAMVVSAIVLVPEMTPPRANVTHRVEVSNDGRTFERVGELRVSMATGERVELPIPGGVTTRFVRIATVESPSWVAWREIAVLRCGGRGLP